MPSTFSFFGIFLLIGAIPLAIKSTKRIRFYRQAQNWPKVPATIVKSFVREFSAGDGTSYLPEFDYRYSIAGAEYNSTMHTEGLPFPCTEEAAHQMVKRIPVGSTVQVAVSPEDPSCAVLDTGFPKAWHVLQRGSIVACVIGIAITLAEVVFAK